MAVRLSGASLAYSGSPLASVFSFHCIAMRLRLNSLATRSVLFQMYSPSGGGGVVPLISMIAQTDGSLYYLVETAPLAVSPWERTTAAGFLTTGDWITLVVYLDGATHIRVFKDDTEATYGAGSTGGASPFSITSSATLYIGGTLAGAESSFDLDQFAIFDGAPNHALGQSSHRQMFAAGWSLSFFTDYLEGASNRPGQMFLLNAFGSDALLYPVNEWGVGVPTITGTPGYVESPLIIEPASARVEAEDDFGIDTPEVVEQDEGEDDTVLVWDLLQKAWSVWPGMDCISLWPVRNPDRGVEEVFIGGRDGIVRVLNQPLQDNDYEAVATHASALGAQGIEKSPRHVYLYLKEQGAYTVAVSTELDFRRGSRTTRDVSLAAGGALLGSTFILGESKLGGRKQIVRGFDMNGTGEFLTVSLANETAGERFTWIGYEVLWRYRRTIRRGV